MWEPVSFQNYDPSVASYDPDNLDNEITDISFDGDFSDPFHRDPNTNEFLIGGYCVLNRVFGYGDKRLDK